MTVPMVSTGLAHDSTFPTHRCRNEQILHYFVCPFVAHSGSLAACACALYHPRRRLSEAEQMLMVNNLGMPTRADLCVQFTPFPPSNACRPHGPATTEQATGAGLPAGTAPAAMRTPGPAGSVRCPATFSALRRGGYRARRPGPAGWPLPAIPPGPWPRGQGRCFVAGRGRRPWPMVAEWARGGCSPFGWAAAEAARAARRHIRSRIVFTMCSVGQGRAVQLRPRPMKAMAGP